MRRIAKPSGALPGTRAGRHAPLHRGSVERGQGRVIACKWIIAIGIRVGAEIGTFQCSRDAAGGIGQHTRDFFRYEQLVNRAVAYLPMPKKTSSLAVTGFGALAQPDIAARFVEAAYASHLERVRADLDRHPSRVLANALVDTARRNGPVEDIHAGDFRGCPLDQRRVTLREECELMAFASGRLALGMTVCLQFSMERPPRPWPEQVLPYGLA